MISIARARAFVGLVILSSATVLRSQPDPDWPPIDPKKTETIREATSYILKKYKGDRDKLSDALRRLNREVAYARGDGEEYEHREMLIRKYGLPDSGGFELDWRKPFKIFDSSGWRFSSAVENGRLRVTMYLDPARFHDAPTIVPHVHLIGDTLDEGTRQILFTGGAFKGERNDVVALDPVETAPHTFTINIDPNTLTAKKHSLVAVVVLDPAWVVRGTFDLEAWIPGRKVYKLNEVDVKPTRVDDGPPADGEQGQEVGNTLPPLAVVGFVVEKDGSVSDVRIVAATANADTHQVVTAVGQRRYTAAQVDHTTVRCYLQERIFLKK